MHAADLGDGAGSDENDDWKTVFVDAASGEPVVPNGSMGHRYGEEGVGKWNLELGDEEPTLTLLGSHDELVAVDLPRFDNGEAEGGVTMRRGVPAKRVGGHLVTTVFDLLLAQYGVGREGLPGEWPAGYEDPEPYTPAWQQEITGVDAGRVRRIAREFARNAERSEGRSMILMGAGTNHWYHSDEIYRSMLALVMMCGCQGVNGGGWAHYVGQEKVRPITGWSTLAFAFDWTRPTRHMAGTALWYLASSQWRYDTFKADELSSPLGKGKLAGKHMADCVALSARLGWLPSYPSFNRNPLDLTDEAEREGHRRKRVRRAGAEGGPAQVRRRRPRRPGELPARPYSLALQPLWLFQQGPRVLPQAPARRPRRDDPLRRVARGAAPRRANLA